MNKNFFYLTLIACLSTNLASCSDDNNKTEEKKGIAVQTIVATTSIEYMSERVDWNFRFGNIEYNWTMKDRILTATSPKSEPYYFENNLKEGETLHPANRKTVQLVSPNYYNSTKSTGPTPPRIQDQSTQEKFRNADLLSYEYEGIVSKDIKDVVFTHDNALLDFIVEGIPLGATVKAYQSFIREVTPLYLENSIGRLHFQAIVLNGYPTAVAVVIDGEYYLAHLMDQKTKVERNTRYFFHAKFDQETKVLKIENLESQVWDE